jgi:RND family efflux transporter MFP subunit
MTTRAQPGDSGGREGLLIPTFTWPASLALRPLRTRPTRVALLLLVVLASSCSKPAPEDVESETVVPVTVAKAETGTLTAQIHASGLVTPAPGAELIVVAPEPARIAEIPKAEGDAVRRGDVLVQFDIPSAQAEASKQRAEIGRAQARLASARAGLTRANDLFARGVAARKEVEAATREVADAEADLAGAQAQAVAAERVEARSVVRATFDGIVARRSHNPGDLVEAAASDAVLRVIDPRRLEVTAAVPISDAPRVRVGATARLADVPAGSADVALKVVSRPVAVEQGSVTVPVRLALTAPANYPSGTPVQVAIDAETHSGVVIVPTSAIVREGDETAVFILSGDKAERRAVMTGIAAGEQVEIASGVKAGESVIVGGQNGLPDGARVTTSAAGSAAGAPADKAAGSSDEK